MAELKSASQLVDRVKAMMYPDILKRQMAEALAKESVDSILKHMSYTVEDDPYDPNKVKCTAKIGIEPGPKSRNDYDFDRLPTTGDPDTGESNTVSELQQFLTSTRVYENTDKDGVTTYHIFSSDTGKKINVTGIMKMLRSGLR